jgi:hypothetical protein
VLPLWEPDAAVHKVEHYSISKARFQVRCGYGGGSPGARSRPSTCLGGGEGWGSDKLAPGRGSVSLGRFLTEACLSVYSMVKKAATPSSGVRDGSFQLVSDGLQLRGFYATMEALWIEYSVLLPHQPKCGSVPGDSELSVL